MIPQGQTLESMERPIERLYFQIGDVADACMVAPSAIRHIEASFGPIAHRNRKGNREYTQAEKARVVALVELTRYFHYDVVRDMADKTTEELEQSLKIVMHLVYGGVMRSLKKEAQKV